jgi:pyruvate/2-oxoglutarate dehydrogenase complex dihydrolipoamide acyltransferase (E2) component
VKEVRIPKMGMSTVEVDVMKVFVKPGQRVTPSDLVAEVEAEKSTLAIEAGVAGVVSEVLVEEGDERQVGDVIVRIDEE